MASRKRGALYIGLTNNLHGRVTEHKSGIGSKHVQKYNIFRLVHYDVFDDVNSAIDFEKRLKRWRRSWKHEMIEEHNLEWRDLYADL